MNPEKSKIQNKEFAFDCYCKRVIKNETRKFYNELKRQKSREVLYCELTEQERKQLFTHDIYFKEDNAFSVFEYRIYLCDSSLADALKTLPEQKRTIILLYYLIGLTDNEIGKRLLMQRATVQYNRKRALNMMALNIKKMQNL